MIGSLVTSSGPDAQDSGSGRSPLADAGAWGAFSQLSAFQPVTPSTCAVCPRGSTQLGIHTGPFPGRIDVGRHANPLAGVLARGEHSDETPVPCASRGQCICKKSSRHICIELTYTSPIPVILLANPVHPSPDRKATAERPNLVH